MSVIFLLKNDNGQTARAGFTARLRCPESLAITALADARQAICPTGQMAINGTIGAFLPLRTSGHQKNTGHLERGILLRRKRYDSLSYSFEPEHCASAVLPCKRVKPNLYNAGIYTVADNTISLRVAIIMAVILRICIAGGKINPLLILFHSLSF
ncbi:MAG: hypothetical protein LBL79_02320 [Prevotella sp.]|nr:hypothetical protein [Prevotella sp.]